MIQIAQVLHLVVKSQRLSTTNLPYIYILITYMDYRFKG